jgi:hypothetical protein
MPETGARGRGAAVTFHIQHPRTWSPERRYALQWMLGQRLGQELTFEEGSRQDTVLTLVGAPGALVISEGLFLQPDGSWTGFVSPVSRLDECPTVDGTEILPVIFGSLLPSGRWWSEEGETTRLGIDVIGTVFWCLTRLEELVSSDRDCHGRFPDSAALGVREGWANRPLADESLALLASLLVRRWPQLQLAQKSATMMVSFDVDVPFSVTDVPAKIVLRSIASDLIRRQNPALAFQRAGAWMTRSLGGWRFDPHDSFDFLMDTLEARGIKGSFNFIPSISSMDVDGDHHVRQPHVQALMKRISDRGHALGLHPSYFTMGDPERLKREFDLLLSTADGLGIQQSVWGGRQHYLRWRVQDSWSAWQEAGLHYDSSVGFNSRFGFRAGTCHAYAAWDHASRKPMALMERPLIVMDVARIPTEFDIETLEDTCQDIRDLSLLCKRHGGEMVLLWHNSSVLTTRHRRIFSTAIEAAGGVA